MSLPEDFLWPQTLKLSAHRVHALERSIHIQGAKDVLGAYLVEVKGDTSDVSPGPRLVAVLRFVHNCTLRWSETTVTYFTFTPMGPCTVMHNICGQMHLLRPPCLSRPQGHEHGVVRQGHEELVGIDLCPVLLTGQRQRHCRQGQQQRVAYLQHRKLHTISWNPGIEKKHFRHTEHNVFS